MSLPIITDDGRWVNADYAYLAEVIKDYDEFLALGWIPPEHRQPEVDPITGQVTEHIFPYAILDSRTGKVVFHIFETETPEDVLTRLFLSDDRHGPVLDRLQARNDAIEIWNAKKNMEQLQEAEDEALHMVKSPMNYYQYKHPVDGVIKLDDQRRRIE